MIKTIKSFMLRAMTALMLLVPVSVPVAVSAQGGIDDGLCSGANLSVQDAQNCDLKGDEDSAALDGIISLTINMFSLVVGVISVIMIIIGGLKYITSGGEGTNITGAKNTILYAIIGLVVVALAQVVVRFVLARTSDSI